MSGPGPWQLYAKAKFYIGRGDITLGAGIFKMSLHRASASAAIMRLSTRSTFASIPGEISAAPFTISPETCLTVTPATNGVFTLQDAPPQIKPGTGVLILTGGHGLGP